jgi:hypothetical protein
MKEPSGIGALAVGEGTRRALSHDVKPAGYADILAAIKNTGVAAVLLALAEYAAEEYDRAFYEAHDREGPFGASRIDGSRQTHRWMSLGLALKDAASRFDEDSRRANMSDEELAAEDKSRAIAKAERNLELARSGKVPNDW